MECQQANENVALHAMFERSLGERRLHIAEACNLQLWVMATFQARHLENVGGVGNDLCLKITSEIDHERTRRDIRAGSSLSWTDSQRQTRRGKS